MRVRFAALRMGLSLGVFLLAGESPLADAESAPDLGGVSAGAEA